MSEGVCRKCGQIVSFVLDPACAYDTPFLEYMVRRHGYCSKTCLFPQPLERDISQDDFPEYLDILDADHIG